VWSTSLRACTERQQNLDGSASSLVRINNDMTMSLMSYAMYD